MYQDLIKSELTEAADVLNKFLSDEHNIAQIEAAAKTIADSFKQGGKVLSCGNGGSHCDAMHFAEELTGRYRENRPGYPALRFQIQAIFLVSVMILVMTTFFHAMLKP